jgi:Tfp pilus assembly protein FimT
MQKHMRFNNFLARARVVSNKEAGFTLVEMLCTIIIVVMVSLLMVVLVSLGSKSMAQTVNDSETNILASTLTTAVEDELRYATNVTGSTQSDIRFFSHSHQGGAGCYITVNSNDMLIVRSEITGKDYALVEKGAYVHGATASVELNWSAATKTFTGTVHVYNSSGKEMASRNFSVEVFNR